MTTWREANTKIEDHAPAISMDMNSEPISPTTLTDLENRAATHGVKARIERPTAFPDSAALAQRNRKSTRAG